MVTHLFYHQETVEKQCAINSWLSIRNWIIKDDEVIIFDLGNTLDCDLPLVNHPKYMRIEKIRTDVPQEKSYTYGLNLIVPLARFDWIILWRSDYIYHANYYPSLLKGMNLGNIVVPYEAFIGNYYCNGKWCKRNLNLLRNSSEEVLLKHSHVCAVYESMDIVSFAIRKNIWVNVGGMDQRLWGYGPQYPELFSRLKSQKEYKESVRFDMFSFHQTHKGTFGLGLINKKKFNEVQAANLKIINTFGSLDQYNAIKSKHFVQEPLRQRRDKNAYRPKIPAIFKIVQSLRSLYWSSEGKGINFFLKEILKRLKGLKVL